MIALFVLSVTLLLWPWVGYPAAMWGLARLARRPTIGEELDAPGVSVVIAARDESTWLDAKLASLRDGGIPEQRLEILVVDDGSRDDTAWIATARGARVISLPEPRGKAIALDAGVEAASHPLVVLTDARQPVAPGSLAALARPFGDPRVGAVSGELVGAARGAGAIYRRFDDALRRFESASGSMVGVTGALWACRRALFPRLPAGLILDDVLAPMCVARAGRRVVVEPDAKALERDTHRTPEAERRRRVRTLAGSVQLLARAPWLLVPIVNPLWGRFVQHKLLRLVGPFALLGVVASLAALAPRGNLWVAMAGAVAAACVLALLGRRAGAPGVLARGFLEAQLLCASAWRSALLGRAVRLWRDGTPAPPVHVATRGGQT
jgi:cellulose synthase/poly-beta-1,6-N-acetylglucosamine synthase-like glycosyltransferase